MKALVLEDVGVLNIRDISVYEDLGSDDVRIKMKRVGICGSDVHFYTHGKIGPFELKAPMILGHEGSGEIVEVGRNVKGLKIGDRVCMEPGIPNFSSKAAKLGIYNLDPELTFWATPPIHGCMCEEVVHPAILTYKLPENVSFEEAAMVEPLAIGMQSAKKAEIKPGDTALIYGAGTIGVMTLLSALAGGCSKVIVADILEDKLDLLKGVPGCITCDISMGGVESVVAEQTNGWGVDIVFEASGAGVISEQIFNNVCPGGHVVYIGMPVGSVSIDIVEAQSKEIRIDTIFRYANVYDRAVSLIGSKKIDLKPFITDVYGFNDSVEAFEYAKAPRVDSVKVMIDMDR